MIIDILLIYKHANKIRPIFINLILFACLFFYCGIFHTYYANYSHNLFCSFLEFINEFHNT